MEMLLHIKNLPRIATMEDVRQFFHGINIPVNGIRILGGQNGDAFVTFHEKGSLLRALDLDGHSLHGQTMSFLLAKPEDVGKVVNEIRLQQNGAMPSQSMPVKRPQAPGYGSGMLVDAPWLKRPRMASPQQRPPEQHGTSAYDREAERLRGIQAPVHVPGYIVVHHLSPTTTAKDLRQFFQGLLIADGGIIMRGSDDSLSTVNAYIHFVQMKDAVRAECLCAGMLHGQAVQIDLISETQFEYQKHTLAAQVQANTSYSTSSTSSAQSTAPPNIQTMKASPFMAMFENNLHQKQCYLGLWNLPEKVTACEIWGWFGGVDGKAIGVTMGTVPEDHSMSMAFVVFRDVTDRLAAKNVWQCARYYSAHAAHRFLVGLSDRCPIFMSTTHKQDFQLPLKERRRLTAQATSGDGESAKIKPLYTMASDESRNFSYIYIPHESLYHSVTACELWSIFATSGKCLGVTLVRSQEGNAIIAYAAFSNAGERQNVLKENKHVVVMKSVNVMKALRNVAQLIHQNKVVSESTASGEERILDAEEKAFISETYFSAEEQAVSHTETDDPKLSRQAAMAHEGHALKQAEEAAQLLASPPLEDKSKSQKVYFLLLTKLPTDVTASALCDSLGPDCQTVLMICDTKGAPFYAYAGFPTMALAWSSRAKYPYSKDIGNINLNIANIEPNCAIWLSSGSGQDQLMTQEQRNIYKYKAYLKQELSHRKSKGKSTEALYTWVKHNNRAYSVDKNVITTEAPKAPATATSSSEPTSSTPAKTTTTPTTTSKGTAPQDTEASTSNQAAAEPVRKKPVARLRRVVTASGICKPMFIAENKPSPVLIAPPENELLPPPQLTPPELPKPTFKKKIKINIPSFGVKK